MSRSKGTITPKYSLHKASGRATVGFDGKTYYLGEYGSTESKQKYERMIAEWYLRGRQGPSAGNVAHTTVAQIACGWLEHIRMMKPLDHRQVTAARWVTEAYGDTPAAEFGSMKLMALRMKKAQTNSTRWGKPIDEKMTRVYINSVVLFIKAMFRWAAGVEMIPASVWHSVSTVTPWRRGESPARESEFVQAADTKDVDAILEVANPVLGAMIRLQLLTGMRSGEVTQMRAVDIDTSGPLWRYKPQTHKTQKKGVVRIIPLGPQAQEVLRPFLRTDVGNPIFRPCDSDRYHTAVIKCTGGYRVVSVQRCRAVRAKEKAFKSPVYCTAIKNACVRAERLAHHRNPEAPADQVLVKRWHSHQLRHTAASYIRDKYGIDAAQSLLGHTSRTMTERYAKPGNAGADQAMSEVG